MANELKKRKVEPGRPDIYVAVMGNESHCSGLERRSSAPDAKFLLGHLLYEDALLSWLWAWLESTYS